MKPGNSIRLIAAAALAIACVQFSAHAADKKMMIIKAIPLKGLKTNFRDRGSVDKPSEITNADELAKAIDDEEIQATVKAAVNFKTQRVLLFRWAGSGQDKLEHKVDSSDDEPRVVFEYRRGRTRDLRGHAKLFVIQKGIKWKVE